MLFRSNPKVNQLAVSYILETSVHVQNLSSTRSEDTICSSTILLQSWITFRFAFAPRNIDVFAASGPCPQKPKLLLNFNSKSLKKWRITRIITSSLPRRGCLHRIQAYNRRSKDIRHHSVLELFHRSRLSNLIENKKPARSHLTTAQLTNIL